MKYKAVVTCKQGNRLIGGRNPYWEAWGIPISIDEYPTWQEAQDKAEDVCNSSAGSCWNPRVEVKI